MLELIAGSNVNVDFRCFLWRWLENYLKGGLH